MSGISSVKSEVTIQRAAAIKIQASVRGHQLRNKQLRNKQLLEAAKIGDISEVKNLLARGADVNATDSEGTTALHVAVKFRHVKIVEALVIAGADLTDNDGGTVLDWAKDRDFFNIKNAIEEGKKKLISLYKNQQCQLQTVVNSPIHECESLREPLLQNKPEKLNETQIQQAIKYRKEKKLGTINSLIKIIFQV